jgi:WD40 repeat protein
VQIEPGAMHALAISPDGRRLATATASGDIGLRDASDGRVLRTLSGHTDEVLGLDFSRDGSRLASAGADGTVRIWEAETGRLIREFRDHGEQVFGVAFHPDGRRVASCSQALDGPNVLVWDSDSGAVLRTIRHGIGQVSSVAFDREGRRLVSTRDQVAVWDVGTGALIASFGGHRSRPERAIFSEDGARIISAGVAEIDVWDADTGRGLFELRGQGGRISGLAVYPGTPTEGPRLATASSDGSLRLWDPTRPVEYYPLRAGPTFARLMSRADEFTALKRDNPVRTVQRLGRLGVGRFTASAFSPARRQLFAAWECVDGTSLHVWDLETMTLACRSVLPRCGLLVFRPDGRLLATDDGGRVVLRDPDTNRAVRTLVGRFHDISALAFSSDGKRLAGTGTVAGVTEMRAGQALNEVRVWDVETGRDVQVLRGFDFDLTALAFGRDGRQLFGFQPGTIYVWEVASGRMSRRSPMTGEDLPAPDPSGAGRAVEVVPGRESPPSRPSPLAPGLHLHDDGRLLLTSYGLFESETGRRLRDVGGDGFSPDGSRLVALTTAGLKVHDADTGRSLLTLSLPQGAYQAGPAFSPDGHFLALLHPDGEILVWDATP